MSILRAVVMALVGLIPAAALAAEIVYPPGSRIGLAPPDGMEISKRFTGFENTGRAAAITLIEMPPQAYDEIAAGLTADALKGQGVTLKSREELKVGEAEAVLVSGEQSRGGMVIHKWLLVVKDPTVTGFVIAQALRRSQEETGAEIGDALKTVAIREPRPIEEQVAALPFRLGDRAGFRPVRVMGGNSVLLTDGPKDVIRDIEQPILVVAQSAGPAPRGDRRAAFARSALLASNTFKDVVIERSQAFRQRGADWHEIVARATDIPSGQSVVVTQTLRFASDHYLRVLGIVRADARDPVTSRFRTVSDAVETN